MYRALLIITIMVTSFLLAGCTSCSDGKKKDRGTSEAPINPMVEKLDETPDSAFLVQVVKYTDYSIYVVTRRTIRSKAYAYRDAQDAGKLKGTLKKGDWYSLFPDTRNRQVITMINTTELSGKWEYNQSEHRGMSFNERGGMSSINTSDICFREWKLLNGLLYVYYVDLQQKAGDRHQYEVEEANIAELSADKLTLQFHGTTYHCRRPSSKPLKFK